MDIKQINIQKLESLDDLDLLIQGDIIPIVFQYCGTYSSEQENLGVYHKRSHSNQLQFLVPYAPNNKHIVMYQAGKNHINIKEGKVFINENQSSTKSFIPEQYDYSELNKTLVNSGLRYHNNAAVHK